MNDEIAEAIVGWQITDQTGIDLAMIEPDGTDNKERLGQCYSTVSLLWLTPRQLRLAALPLCGWGWRPYLPVPMMNIMNGGACRRRD